MGRSHPPPSPNHAPALSPGQQAYVTAYFNCGGHHSGALSAAQATEGLRAAFSYREDPAILAAIRHIKASPPAQRPLTSFQRRFVTAMRAGNKARIAAILAGGVPSDAAYLMRRPQIRAALETQDPSNN